MNVLISIDDTDNLDSPGTGELSAEIARMIEVRGWGETSFITRHQLFVHPDIPYTSHNSAMCFVAVVDPDCRETLIADAGNFLASQSAPGSDPGLCVVVASALADASALVGFGQTAKGSVLTKNDAYNLAQHLGVHLSEHGGTGQGVIGALAGAGLRLSGNDGRIRRRLALPPGSPMLSVKALRDFPEVDAVQTRAGETLPDDAEVTLNDKVKTVLIGGRSTLLVTSDLQGGNTYWRSCSKQELKCY
jgi:hypothetical protein